MCMLSVRVPAASHPFKRNSVSRQPLHGPLSVASNSKIAALAVFAQSVSGSGRAERGWYCNSHSRRMSPAPSEALSPSAHVTEHRWGGHI